MSRLHCMTFLTVFQSTLLQEERQLDCALKISIFNISIHAPTRGATINLVVVVKLFGFQSTLLQEERQKRLLYKCYSIYDFNPRSYKRSDEGGDKVNLLTQIFQSTLLQEERLLISLYIFYYILFQSTLLQEERLIPVLN